MTVVDPDSVSAVLAVTREMTRVERALKPDMLISQQLVGAGDTMSVLVTIRDVHFGNVYGARVASAKFAVSDPEASIPELLHSILGQVESLSKTPVTFRFVRPGVPTAPRLSRDP